MIQWLRRCWNVLTKIPGLPALPQPLICQRCGGKKFEYLETVINVREVYGWAPEGTLLIRSFYRTEDEFPVETPQVVCQTCGEEYELPENVDFG